jgi:hypothetical protein
MVAFQPIYLLHKKISTLIHLLKQKHLQPELYKTLPLQTEQMHFGKKLLKYLTTVAQQAHQEMS